MMKHFVKVFFATFVLLSIPSISNSQSISGNVTATATTVSYYGRIFPAIDMVFTEVLTNNTVWGTAYFNLTRYSTTVDKLYRISFSVGFLGPGSRSVEYIDPEPAGYYNFYGEAEGVYGNDPNKHGWRDVPHDVFVAVP